VVQRYASSSGLGEMIHEKIPLSGACSAPKKHLKPPFELDFPDITRIPETKVRPLIVARDLRRFIRFLLSVRQRCLFKQDVAFD
jgi:hypothetical protein